MSAEAVLGEHDWVLVLLEGAHHWVLIRPLVVVARPLEVVAHHWQLIQPLVVVARLLVVVEAQPLVVAVTPWLPPWRQLSPGQSPRYLAVGP